ncbi:hypothetical protein V6N11_060919 [Hibiscus sabdariffa]|uniref:Transposase MuDR plant domain-containing protein n=1 Tax=Hibiscus sabdariffa TaxID=183260 RepID=A0ABR2QRR5_9ROSI
MNVVRGSNAASGFHVASGPNDGSGPHTTSGTNERVDEVFYEELNDVDGDSSESDWVDGDNLLSDDDDEEMVAIKNKSKLVEDLGPDVVLEESMHVSIEENEDLKGLGSGEETDYLDSSDAGSYETDSDGGIICKKSGKVFFDASTVEPRFQLGMIFESQQQFKDTLYSYAIAHSFDFRFVSNRKEKIRVVCKANGCPFLIHTSWDKSDGCYKIKTLVIEHQCSITFKNKRANYKLVGKHFLSKFRILPKLKIVEMQKLGREELKVELQKHTCIKARKWALEKIRGSVVLEFNRLFDYVFALRCADPNGTFELMVERTTEVEKPKFRRLYVCFSALKKGFKRFCRPVISLDGCFLKWPFKGEILSVVGRDGNNQIFPIAWALVEVENRDTWTWFLQNIQNDLNLGDGSNFTLISDMQKVQTESAQTKFAQPATSSPPTQPMPTSPHTQPSVLSRPSRYNVTPEKLSQVLLSKPHIRSNWMASTTSQPIISQSHSTSSHPIAASSRQSTTVSKPQGERRPKLPTMKRTNTMRRP